MTAVSHENPLPRMSRATIVEVLLLHPIKLAVLDHDFVMDEIVCQSLLDHDKYVDDKSYGSGDLNINDEDDDEETEDSDED